MSGDYAILLGPSTSTGGFRNSIAIGGYATNTSMNQMMIGSATKPINSISLNGDNDDVTIRTKKTTVTSAELLSIASSPLELVPAPGLGKIINILDVFYTMSSGTDYTGTTHVFVEVSASGGSGEDLNDIDLTRANGVYRNAPMTTQRDLGTDNNGVWLSAFGNPSTGTKTMDIFVTYKIVNA